MSEGPIAGYELWDTESGNLLDDFDTEVEALAAVRAFIALDGPDWTKAIAITCVRVGGRMTTLAMGEVLVDRAQSGAPSHERRLA